LNDHVQSTEGHPVAVAHGGAGAVAASCKNCGAPLVGRFCSNCSQSADVHVPSTGELLHELLEGLTHSDSRLWRTLQFLWLKPGKLTTEFVAGRRMAYLPPFRLYLVLSVMFFLLASLSHPAGDVVLADGSAAPGNAQFSRCDGIDFEAFAQRPALNDRIRHVCREVLRDNGANLMHVALNTLSKAMFIFLPLIAFLHMLMYWRPRYRYAEHLLFFVHVHAFYFSAAIVMLSAVDAAQHWAALRGAANVLATLLGWSIPLYTVLALRRVFTKSWSGALVKSVALSCIYLTAFALTVAGVFVYAMWQL
jgi:Protein of unknown function (DUF3667)